MPVVGFLRLPVYLLIPILLALVACDGSTSTPAPAPDIEATVQAAIIDALPTSAFTPAPDVEATVIAAVRATVTALPTPTPTITPTSTPVLTSTLTPTSTPVLTSTMTPTPAPVLTSTMTPTPTPTQTPTSQFEAVCASGERLVRIYEFGVIPGNLIVELEAISKICGFSWCNPQYCHILAPE